MKVGEIDVVPILDGEFVIAEPAGFPPKDSPEFEPHRSYITNDGRWLMDIGAFVVRTGDRVLLIDAGAGPGTMQRIGPNPYTGIADADPKLVAYNRQRGLEGAALERALAMTSSTEIRHGMLAANLERQGIAATAITDVVCYPTFILIISDGSAAKISPFFPMQPTGERRDLEFFLGAQPHDETF